MHRLHHGSVSGALGLLAFAYMLTPRPAVAGRVRALAAGDGVSCTVSGDGNLRLSCWGRNDHGQLGDGTTTERVWPVVGPFLSAAVATRDQTTCVLTLAGIYCTGANDLGQLGDGTTVEQHTFHAIGRTSSDFPFSAGNTPCAGRNGGFGVTCWGWNQFGEVGDGTTVDRLLPADVAASLPNLVALESSGADGHTCAINRDTAGNSQLWCWGNNDNSALGVGSSVGAYSSTPVRVTAADPVAASSFGTLAVGRDVTCVIAGSGILCWGRNDYGQLGDGTTTPRETPVRVPFPQGFGGRIAISVSPTGDFACASGNTVLCWGRNDRGQLGDGTTIERHVPVPVAYNFVSELDEVAAGNDHTCAHQAFSIRPRDRVYCWGANDHGQLGDGTHTERHKPWLAIPSEPPQPIPASTPFRRIWLVVALLLAAAVATWARAKRESTRHA